MGQANMKRTVHLMVVGLVWAITGIVPAQAGQVVGQVTAVDAALNTITIDGIKFELSATAVKKANARDADTLLRGFKPGQPILYEVDKNKLERIEAIEGGVDFPVLLRPPSRVP
jgi:hypothetical protein